MLGVEGYGSDKFGVERGREEKAATSRKSRSGDSGRLKSIIAIKYDNY